MHRAAPQLLIKRLDPGLELPEFASPGDAGLDLRSRVDVSLAPGARHLVPTGVSIALPPGYVGLVHPRSGLAWKAGVTVLNGPGTIDASYRGEICVILINTDPAEQFDCHRGDRIAQLVIIQFAQVSVCEVEELPGTHRAARGFGSSGT